MTRHLHHDMERLHRDILALCSTVEGMIDKSMRSLVERRYEFVDEITNTDRSVDQREVVIEEECLKMLALHQPVAGDLRRITTVLKINNDLERIADLAVNVAERAKCLGQYPPFQIPPRMDAMVGLTVKMLRGALDAYVHLDAAAARSIIKMDDDVDEYNVLIIEELQDLMQRDSSLVVPALHCFSAARHIERIGDLATNIAEDVIYLVDGDIVRHQRGMISASPD